MEILIIMSEKSSINKVSSIRVYSFFYFPYIYKNRVLAYFQTRPKKNHNMSSFNEFSEWISKFNQ